MKSKRKHKKIAAGVTIQPSVVPRGICSLCACFCCYEAERLNSNWRVAAGRSQSEQQPAGCRRTEFIRPKSIRKVIANRNGGNGFFYILTFYYSGEVLRPWTFLLHRIISEMRHPN